MSLIAACVEQKRTVGMLVAVQTAAVIMGFVLVAAAAFPMAVFGILPQAMVADVAEYDAGRTGENREGMFYAARTFAFKLGQSVSMLLFTALATVGNGGGQGYRVVACVSAALALVGGILLFWYDEKKILKSMG